MKRPILVLTGAIALALAAGTTTSAMAFDHGVSGLHVRNHVVHGRFHSVLPDDGYHETRSGLAGAGPGTYCPAFSRCGAGLPD